MKYLILNKNKKVVLTKEKAASGTLSDEILPISSLEPTNVANYGYVQVVAEDLRPENIMLGKTILGVSGNVEDFSKQIIRRTIVSYNDNIGYIGSYAFAGCTNLTTVSLPQCSFVGSYAFNACENLTTISLPQCIEIGSSAFRHCSNLTTVDLPMYRYVNSYIFQYCNALTNVNLPQCSDVGSYAFSGYTSLTTISLPQCIEIGSSAFQNCRNLTSISLPMCIRLENKAFSGCSKLESVYFFTTSAPTLRDIYAFQGTPLSNSTYLGYYGSIYVPAGAVENFRNATNWTMYADRITPLENDYTSEYIYGWEFASSTLTEIPQERRNVITLGRAAFRHCSNLTTVDLPQCNYIGNVAFSDCSSLTTISLPQCIGIGSGAFYKCSSLTSVDLPQCRNIDEHAFRYCSSLTSISLPVCGYIWSWGFAACTSLTSISLPMCVRIGEYAFNGCTKLESVYLNVSSVPQLAGSLSSNTAFYSTPLRNSTYLGYYGSIYVPHSLYNSFKTAKMWSYYSKRFVSYSF